MLVDDHVLMRAGIRLCLQSLPDVEVVGEAGDGHQALAMLPKLLPDVVIMDIGMPSLNGIETTVRIKAESPAVRVIICSSHSEEEKVLSALHAGADGYLLKNAPMEDLQRAVMMVAAGETFLSPNISRQLINISLRGGRATTGSQFELLTSRQREILQLVAEGKTTKEIAFFLNLSVKTVEAHRAQLMERLEIHDVAGLVRYAMRMGLVSG